MPMRESKDQIEGRERQAEMLAKVVAANIGYLKVADLIDAGDARSARLLNRLSRKLRFDMGQQVCPAQDGERVLIIIVEGAVNLFLRHRGREKFLKRVEKGYVVGEMASWGQRMLNTRAVAAASCEVWMLDESAAGKLKRSSIELLLRLQEIGVLMHCQCVDSRVDGFRPFEARLARFLIDKADAKGIVSGLTHAHIAAAFGTHRETVTKAMRILARRRWIKSERKKITLLDRDALREFAS
jgi:CRP-like cAMP-binding protein